MKIDTASPEKSPPAPATGDSRPLRSRFADDPWSLSLEERRELARSQAASQAHWLPRVRGLVEPPLPDDAFPAFAVELAPFAHLGRSLGGATSITELATGVADELQRFVDQYGTWSTTLDPAWQPTQDPEMIEP